MAEKGLLNTSSRNDIIDRKVNIYNINYTCTLYKEPEALSHPRIRDIMQLMYKTIVYFCKIKIAKSLKKVLGCKSISDTTSL